MQIKTKIVSCHAAKTKPVKLEVNGTVILPPLVFPGGRKMQGKGRRGGEGGRRMKRGKGVGGKESKRGLKERGKRECKKMKEWWLEIE